MQGTDKKKATPGGLLAHLARKSRSHACGLGLLLLVYSALTYLQPVTINRLYADLAAGGRFWAAFGAGCIYFCLLAVKETVLQAYYWISSQAQARLLPAVESKLMIFSQLRHRFSEDKSMTGGILGFDGQTLSNLNRNVFDLLFNLAAIILSFYHLWTVIGAVAAIPIVMLFAFFPCIRWLSNVQMRRFGFYFQARDARLGLTGESLFSLREIILSRMGERFRRRLNELRGSELLRSKSVARLSIATVLIYGGSSVALSVGSFLGYFAVHGEMPFVVVLNCLLTFEIIRTPLSHLSFNISHLVNLLASARRTADYLNAGVPGVVRAETADGEGKNLLTLTSLHAGQGEDRRSLISGLDLAARPGERIVVLGRRGAGKTLLLRMLAGVPVPHTGRLSLHVHPSDVVLMHAEVPLYAGSLKGNLGIPAGQRPPEWLPRVFSLLPQSAGGHGLANRRIDSRSVSGGQRKKIGMARAFLGEGKILLLDEPFAGLDDASRQQAQDFICADDGSGRAVIVATNYLPCAEAFDKVIAIVGNGQVLVGPHKDLYRGHAAYREFFDSYAGMEAAASQTETEAPSEPGPGTGSSASGSEWDVSLEKTGFLRPLASYCRILRQLGSRHLPIYLLLLPVVTFMPVLLDIIVTGRFSDIYRIASLRELSAPQTLSLYCLATLLYVIAKAAKRWSWVELVNMASQSIFTTVMGGLIGNRDFSAGGTAFTTAAGRFTKDLDVVDNDILWSLDELLESVFDLLFLIAVVILMAPLAVLAIPLLYLNLRGAVAYMARKKRSYLQLCRLAERKNGLVQEILQGRAVSDARWSAGALQRYRRACRRYADCLMLNSKIDRLFFVEANFLAAAALLAILAGLMVIPSGAQGAGLVMLFVFSQKIFNASLYLLGEISANGLHLMNLDRLFSLIPGSQAPTSARKDEREDFEGFSGFKLDNAGMSLGGRKIFNGLTLDFQAGDKIFVIGPNGAGKSSLLMLINGNYPPDQGELLTRSGPRVMPGLPTHLITYVPQRTFVYAGSLFDNIDANLMHTEASLADRLRDCGLAPLFEAELGDLKDLGKNIDPSILTDGQKQFIGLIRAVADTRPIILLDEPMANGSMACLALIDQMLQTAWKDCTVICVAHDLFLQEHFHRCYDLGKQRWAGQAI